MIDSSSETSVTFCNLVEHPAGSDGGEFPHYSTYRVYPDGSLVLDTGLPESPTDTFVEQDPGTYVSATSREWAVAHLAQELDRARLHVQHLETVLARARYDTGEYRILFDEEPYDPTAEAEEVWPDM